jgi:SWI/SNF-related matrix-associated actin-dependent regulator of chromatin subfamily D
MIKSLSIEMDRDPSVYPDTNHVQWIDRGNWGSYNAIGAYVAGLNKQPGDSSTSGTENPAEGLNGFALTRHGDVPTRLRVSLHLNHNPERVKVNGQLAAIIGMYEDTRPNVLNAFWHYVKSNGLQDKNDRKLIKLDDRLRGVFKFVHYRK